MIGSIVRWCFLKTQPFTGRIEDIALVVNKAVLYGRQGSRME